MAYYIKNLQDANGDIIYPITRTTAIYTSSDVVLQTFLDTLQNITVSSTQPSSQNTGDFWYEVT